MLNALAMAIASADLQDWTTVLEELQQLPWSARKEEASGMSGSEWQMAEALAIKVLVKGDFSQRWEISKVIHQWEPSALDPLLRLLGSDEVDPEARWFISRVLSHFDHPASLLALVQLLHQDQDEELAAIAAQSLAAIGPASIDALQPLLTDDHLRLLAVKALAQIHHPETINLLLTVVSDRDPQIRRIAIEALGNFPDERIMPILMQSLRDPAAVVRREGVSALGRYSDPDGRLQLVNHLQPLLFDFSEQVSVQTAIALGRIGTREAAQALFPVLKSLATPLDLKLAIVRAFGWIEDPIALLHLQEGLRWSDSPVCLQIIHILGSQSLPALKSLATEILIEFFNSEQQASLQPEIRQALAMALGELGEQRAIALLRQLAEDRDRGVSLHALAALRKIPALQVAPGGE